MMETPARPPPVVMYRAISVLNSRTLWFNLATGLLAILSLSEVTTLIPARFLPVLGAVVAIVNMYLRTVTTRPVAFIAAGATRPVAVPKIGPPDRPPTVGD